MNERIKQMIEKSGLYIAYDNKEVTDKELEFFAELIVKECVAICQDIDGEDNIDARSGRQDCAIGLKQHFGVEEQDSTCPDCGEDGGTQCGSINCGY